MKKGFLSQLFLMMFLSSLYAQDSGTELDGATIQFEIAAHDFGDIVQGDKVNFTFEFKNTGNQPLILSNVLVQCGCTATEWPRDPVLPGKSGKIAVNFDSAGKSGMQNKVITVVSNATNAHERVKIITNVLPK